MNARTRGDKRRRGTRRGGKGKYKTTSLVILNNNVCGLNSKKHSIPKILNKVAPDICTFQETNVTGQNRINVDKKYHMSFRNRRLSKSATAVANTLKQNWTKIGEGENDDEYLITRLDHVYQPINIVNVYSGQESHMSRKEVLDTWLRLKREIDLILDRQEGVIMVGDYNRSLGNNELGIKGNHDKISYGGQLMREMLEDKQII